MILKIHILHMGNQIQKLKAVASNFTVLTNARHPPALLSNTVTLLATTDEFLSGKLQVHGKQRLTKY